ncbi:fungal chitosanase of glycosyl hydrolase group 75-domain-containing protein, partial [Armillaria mellea]
AADFAADSSIDAACIYELAAASLKGGKSITASYPASRGDPNDVHIQDDWLHLTGVSAYHFLADMDVDCDGVYWKCPGNDDGQDETDFGALDARYVPWYVLPNNFYKKAGVKSNALGAIICDGKMYYGLFGDSNGDTPEVIGEASLLMANTCFPNDKLNGGKGHTPLDVLYIVFPSQVPSGVGKNTIDIGALKKLGDEQALLLAKALKLNSGTSGGGGSGGKDECNSDDDCSGSMVCCIFGDSRCSSGKSSGKCDG